MLFRSAAREPVTGALPLVTLDGAALGMLEDAQGTGAEDLVDPSAPVPASAVGAGPAVGTAAGVAPAGGMTLGARATARTPRPDVEVGLPISAYGDNELDELVAWIASDHVVRDEEQLAGALRAELGITRRSTRVDTAVAGAVRRLLGR